MGILVQIVWRRFVRVVKLRGLDDPAGWFAVLGFVGGVVIVFLTPPFQAMDEPNHFARLWQISEGGILPDVRGNEAGGEIPRSVELTIETWMRMRYAPEVKVGGPETRDLPLLPLAPTDRVYRAFANTALYNPLAYAGHLPGIWAGRQLGLTPVHLLRLTRLTGLLAFVLLMTLALRWLPFCQWPVAVFGLMPVTLFVASSVSADGLAVATAALFTAACLHLRRQSETVRLKQLLGLALIGLVLSLTKMAYLPLLVLWFLVPTANLGTPARRCHATLLVLGIPLLGYAVWALPSLFLHRNPMAGVSPLGQVGYILHHPWAFILVCARTFWERQLPILYMMVGSLGWLETLIPSVHFVGYVALMTFATLTAGERGIRLERRIRVVLLTTLVIGVAFTTALIYLNSTVVGAPIIGDVSGRYFIPLLPILAVGLYNRVYMPRNRRIHATLLLSCLVLNILLTWQTLYARFYA